MNNRMMLPIELTKILYESWQGEISTSSQDSQIYGKCLNGPGKVVFRNGNQYDGEFYNGLLHGKGKFTWANGIVYEGQFSDNRITGRGQYRWPDGSHYEGEVRDGLRHGYGKYTIDDAVYEGEWFEGKKYGRGKIIFASGSIFEGSFKNDMKEGSGKMYYYPSGNFFEGEWKYDQKSGMGTMNWTDIREKYVGNWKNNHQEGWGIHLWLQSKGEGKYLRNRYEGNWKNGVRDGFGVFYYANGSKYEGYWKDNMKEGFAFYTDENGKTSLIQFSKDRMLKGQKPTQLDNQNGKKAANKKEVQPNYYSLCLSVQHFFYPQTPNLQQLYNYLLRNNTQLKGWYKGASSFYDQQSQFSFCLTLQGTWKMIRSLKILGDFSLALFDRGLPRNTPDIQSLLKMVPQVYEQKINYEDIYYQYISSDSGKTKEQSDSHSQRSMIPLPPFKDYSVHDRQANILFRQFVHLLVWMGYHLDPAERPQKSLEKLINKITPFFQTVAKTIKFSGNENLSENKSSISKAEKNLTPFYKNANTEVFKALLPSHRFSTIRKDQVIKIRELLGYGVINNCIGQAEWALLQKIIEKYFDNEVLNRERQELFSTSLIPTKILNVLNYQLIQYQFIQIIYILFIKKLPSTKENEENKKKYQDTLEDLFQARKSHLQQASALKEFKNQVRYIHSAKSSKKKELQARRKLMQQKKAESQAAARQQQRQQSQRQLMSHQDVDIKEMQFQQQASEFQI